VQVRGADVAFRVMGDGPINLLYFYGLGSHVDMFVDDEVPWIAGLRSFSRLIFFDRRGTGLSDPVGLAAMPMWEEWADDVRAVLDAAGADQAAIFASADAGPIALLFAAVSPERVTALVLANTSARFLAADDYEIGVDRGRLHGLIDLVRSTWGTPALVEATSPVATGDAAVTARVAARMRSSATPSGAAAQLQYLLEQLDVRDVLPLIVAPTLVLHNTRNPVVPPSHGQYLASNICGAKYIPLDASGVGLMDAHSAALKEIAQFLTGASPPIDLSRVLATVLFTDIVGSTARAAAVGDTQWRAELDVHDGIVRRLLRQYGGREIRMAGDGVVAEFDGPARAIRCASAIILSLSQLGIEIRAGVHTGECERRGDDLSGLAVHIAARVGAAAAAGEVLVSRTVADLVAGSSISFADRGEHALKGVPGTWRLLAVTGE